MSRLHNASPIGVPVKLSKVTAPTAQACLLSLPTSVWWAWSRQSSEAGIILGAGTHRDLWYLETFQETARSTDPFGRKGVRSRWKEYFLKHLCFASRGGGISNRTPF